MSREAPEVRRARAQADAMSIFRAALKAADPVQAVQRYLRLENHWFWAGDHKYPLETIRNIDIIGAGKAGAAMGKALESILGNRIRRGLINIKYGHTEALARLELNQCGHPVPDRNGLDGAERIAAIAREAGEHDLLICLISGGASALLPLPVEGVTLADLQQITELLLACGATIHEINAVRKHLSQIQGGGLTKLAYPAQVLALLLSDVIGDNIDVIGSGPTVPDSSTFADACAVLTKYDLWGQAPASVTKHLRRGENETPKVGDPVFSCVQNVLVGSNRLAIFAAAERSRALRYHTLILSSLIQGETREAAQVHAAIAMEARASGNPVKPPGCIISGGETTVTVRGKGLGGRNQEFALAAAIDIDGLEDITILSGGTDGTDGPTDAAGAMADGTTIERARALGLNAREYLYNNDSYRFFEALGDLIKTGPTNTNLADVHVMLVR